jgi:hypothetical protein
MEKLGHLAQLYNEFYALTVAVGKAHCGKTARWPRTSNRVYDRVTFWSLKVMLYGLAFMGGECLLNLRPTPTHILEANSLFS